MPKVKSKWPNEWATGSADIVITSAPQEGHYVIYHNGDVIANTDALGCALIAAGAAERKLSVYDVEAGHFLSGGLSQMAP